MVLKSKLYIAYLIIMLFICIGFFIKYLLTNDYVYVLFECLILIMVWVSTKIKW